MDGSGSLDLKFVTHGQYSDNVGSRVYLLDEGGDNYYMFRSTIRHLEEFIATRHIPSIMLSIVQA